jgi:hypothetical protein
VEVTDEAQLPGRMFEFYKVPFDLNSGPLHRLGLFKLADFTALVIVAHRITQLPNYLPSKFLHQKKRYCD